MREQPPFLISRLDVVGLASTVISYSIPHLTVRAPQTLRNSKPAFSIGNAQLSVEHFAQHLLEQNGFKVFKGDDAHLFFSILSVNFKNSFFMEVCRNWVGPNLDSHLSTLEAAVSECLAGSRITEDMIAQAESILMKYYSSYPPKTAIHRALATELRGLDQHVLLNVLRFYRKAQYTTKGAPDLFVVRPPLFCFVEVKSITDSLRPEQYDFIEGFLEMVGDYILVLRILPELKPQSRTT